MIRHIVMWKLQPVAPDRDKAGTALRLKALLEQMRGRVPEIKALSVGINCLGDESNSDLVLTCDFEDLAALDRYQKHPEHQAVAAQIAAARISRAAVDYEF